MPCKWVYLQMLSGKKNTTVFSNQIYNTKIKNRHFSIKGCQNGIIQSVARSFTSLILTLFSLLAHPPSSQGKHHWSPDCCNSLLTFLPTTPFAFSNSFSILHLEGFFSPKKCKANYDITPYTLPVALKIRKNVRPCLPVPPPLPLRLHLPPARLAFSQCFQRAPQEPQACTGPSVYSTPSLSLCQANPHRSITRGSNMTSSSESPNGFDPTTDFLQKPHFSFLAICDIFTLSSLLDFPAATWGWGQQLSTPLSLHIPVPMFDNS